GGGRVGGRLGGREGGGGKSGVGRAGARVPAGIANARARSVAAPIANREQQKSTADGRKCGQLFSVEREGGGGIGWTGGVRAINDLVGDLRRQRLAVDEPRDHFGAWDRQRLK